MGSGSIVKSQDSSSVGQTVFTITVVWLRLFTAAGNTGSPDLTHTVCYSQSHFTSLPGEIWHRLPSADTALLNRNFGGKKSSGSPSVQRSCGEKACLVLQAESIIDEMMSEELPGNLPVSGKVLHFVGINYIQYTVYIRSNSIIPFSFWYG